ncbi:MAG: glycosyltransferase family A protein [Pseudomonadota bacterium]
MPASISCIVPVYNGARFLAEALDSILAQTLPPTEIIVVDDGSTDTTADVAKRYAARVTYVHQANAGPGSARNHGIGLASGDYFAFLDADDLWHPEKLERQLRALEGNPAAGICLTFVQNFWVDELAEERERLRDHDFSKPVLGYVCQCLLARRSVFDLVGGFNESFRIGEDTDWFLRVDQAGIVKQVLTDTLVRRRLHGQNLSYEIRDSQKARSDLLDNVIQHMKNQRSRTPK